MRLFWTIAIILPLATAQGSFWKSLAPSCLFQTLKNAYSPLPIHEGKSINPKMLEQVKDLLPYSKLEYEVRELGKGTGGSTYRIIPLKSQKQAFVVKLTRPMYAVRDEKGFEILRTVLGDHPDISIPIPKIIQVKNSTSNLYGDVIFQLPDTRGETLFNILADPKVPAETKLRLKAKYIKVQNELQTQLADHYQLHPFTSPSRSEYFPSMKGNPLFTPESVAIQPDFLKVNVSVKNYLKHWRNKNLDFSKHFRESDYIEIFFKSDNIIVDAHEHFTLIDPY